MGGGQLAARLPGLRRQVPGLGLVHDYRREWARPDLVAGVVLAAILVPQGMAYAELAGLPAVTGLYTTVACLIGYALMGPSRVLVLGPDSSVSPLIYAAIVPLAATSGDPGELLVLGSMLAVLVGAIEIGLGAARLGFVADLLSVEVQVGYMNGLGITIIVGQLPKLFGFSTDADSFVEEARAFASNLDQTHGTTLAVGVCVLALLLLLPRVTPKVPAILVAIVGVTLVSALWDLPGKGVSAVGTLPQGLPSPDLPWTGFGDVPELLVAALGITLVSLTDTIATSTAFAARRGDEVSADQEMVGLGTSNVAAGLFQGFAVSTSSSRTAVADQSGAKSQVAGLVGAGMVALMLLFFNSLLADLPNTALAAVVIAAALSLINLPEVRRLWQVRRTAFSISVVATLGVVLLGVLDGILIAVALSILLFFRRSWWPHGAVLGRDGRGNWHRVDGRHDLEQVPDIVVYRWEAPLFFANAGLFRQQVRSLVRRRRPRWVVLQCEAVTDVDVTAAERLEKLDVELNEQGVHLAFVEMRGRLAELLLRYGLYETLDRDHFYASMDEALEAIAAEDAAREDPAGDDASTTSGEAPDERP